MNDYGRRYLIEQLRRHDERRSMQDNRSMSDNRMQDNNKNAGSNRDFADNADYYDMLDERRGVRGSGRNMRDREDFADFGSHKMKLTKADLNHWKHNMENTDGTRGEHYDMQQVMSAAEKLGEKFKHFDEREFCTAVNMIYSDYGHIIKRLVPDKDKELLVCADFARAFFDDPDGPEPSEKLAIYYHCIADLG